MAIHFKFKTATGPKAEATRAVRLRLADFSELNGYERLYAKELSGSFDSDLI